MSGYQAESFVPLSRGISKRGKAYGLVFSSQEECKEAFTFYDAFERCTFHCEKSKLDISKAVDFLGCGFVECPGFDGEFGGSIVGCVITERPTREEALKEYEDDRARCWWNTEESK